MIVETVDELVDKLKKRSKGDFMSILVIAEHDNKNLKGATLNTIKCRNTNRRWDSFACCRS